MKFLVVQGSRKIEVDTSQPVAGDDTQPNASAVTLVWTLGVLKQYVEQQFKVPRDCMKLLHKGKSLTGDELTLEQLKVKDGDKIMVLAGQAQPKAQLDEIEQTLATFDANTLQGIEHQTGSLRLDLNSIRQGYLSAAQQAEVLRKATKRRIEVNEQCMRGLEYLDGIQLRREGSTDEDVDRYRAKRKALVQRVQGALSQLDQLNEEMKEMTAQLKDIQEQDPRQQIYPQL